MTAILLALVLLILLCRCGRAWAVDDALAFEGSPREIGALWGRTNAAHIAEDMQKAFLDPAAAHEIHQDELLRRNEAFEAVCRQHGPHWLEEASAIAQAADVEPDLYVAFIGSVYRQLFAGHECTSYAVHRAFTRDNAILFHKNRDNQEKPQAACIVTSNLAGINRFITVTDASVLACMMMVNDKGLAGSADTGALVPTRPKYRGVMNTHILRYIAERCVTCADALEAIRMFVGNGFYAGGDKVSTHWLFVDRTGDILEVSNNTDNVHHRYHTGKAYFSARTDSPAAWALYSASQPIDFHTFHNVSRDPSICFDSSICGMTAEISADAPAVRTTAWFALPAWGLAFPLIMGGRYTPRCLADGSVYRLCRPLRKHRAAWERLEPELRTAASSLDRNDVDRWVCDTAKENAALLEGME